MSWPGPTSIKIPHSALGYVTLKSVNTYTTFNCKRYYNCALVESLFWSGPTALKSSSVQCTPTGQNIKYTYRRQTKTMTCKKQCTKDREIER